MPTRFFSPAKFFTALTTPALGLLLLATTQPVQAQVVLPYTADFETSETYSSGSLDSQHGWQVTQGTASVTTADAFSGTQSVGLAGSTPAAILSQSFTELTGQSVIFVDFYVRPVASEQLDATTFMKVESSEAGFVKVGASGMIYVFDGNGSGGGEWVSTGHSVAIDGNNRATSWVRFTFRQDYTAKKWDLYLDGTMVKANLGFRDDAKAYFSFFSLRGVTSAISYFDYFYAASTNPLFVDADKDGIEDAWETAHGLNPAVNDRNGDVDDDGLSNIEEYVRGTDPEDEDSDGDGMPDGWEVLHHLDPLVNDGMGDADNDGDTNFEEYQNDTDPWPTPIVADGLRAWYRADLGVTKDGEDKVSQWLDLSGHGFNAVQTTGYWQPVLTSGALNGHDAMTFDGNYHALTTSGPVDLTGGEGEMTVIAVVKPEGTQGSEAMILDQNRNGAGGVSVRQTGPNHFALKYVDGSDTGRDSNGATVTTDMVQVYTAVKGTSVTEDFLNGVSQGTVAAGTGLHDANADLTIGNIGHDPYPTYAFNGQVAEVLIYNRALTTGEREDIEAALMTKYIDPDSDDDGLPDAWEQQHLGTLSYGATDDPGDVGRTLLASYEGELSPWPAPTVADGLRAWYRADLGVTKDGEDNVSQWLDLSGQGFHVAQGAAYFQPILTSGALNGHDAMTFDGNYHALTTSGPVDLTGGEGEMTVIAVVKPEGTQGSDAMILDQNRNGAGGVSVRQNGPNHFALKYVDGSDTGRDSNGATVTTDMVQVYTAVKGTSVAEDFLNGVSQGTVEAGSGLHEANAALSIGNPANPYPTYAFNGQVAEVLIYNRALTTGEREDIEAALMTKYIDPDSDDDGLPDAWEQQYLGTLSYGATDDPGDVGRTLLESYEGELSPWPAPTVADGLRAWYRADLGVTKDGEDNVSQWLDLSGQGFHVAQGTAYFQPILASGALNGHDAMAFDGNYHGLSTSGPVDLTGGEGEMTVIAVVKPEGTQGSEAVVLDQNRNGASGISVRQTSPNHFALKYVDGSDTSRDSDGATVTTDSVQVYTVVKGSSLTEDFLNGVSQGTVTAGTGLHEANAALSVGNLSNTYPTYAFNGKIVEVLIYNRALTTMEREDIEAALMTKYISPDGDSDADGLPDAWEQQYLGTLSYGATDDPGSVGRTLLESYEGELSPWPAPTVSDGLRAWYRADLGVTKDGDDKVSQWLDLSGHGFHVAQTATPSQQPTLSVSTLNDQPAVHFDEMHQNLQSSGSVDLKDGADDVTVFVVMKPSALQADAAGLFTWSQTESGDLGLRAGNTNEFALNDLDESAVSVVSPVMNVTPGLAQILTVVKDGTSASSFLNGVSQGANSVPATLAADVAPIVVGNWLAPYHGFTGDIAEILVYNRALTTMERESVETDLATKYVDPDSDDDGLPDAWEMQYLGTLSYGAMDDPGKVGWTLLTSYEGELSPWPAPAVGDGLRAWYRADLGVTKDEGNKVSQWLDLSGHGLHLSQTTVTAYQPNFAAAAVRGQPAVSFGDDEHTHLRTKGPRDLFDGADDVTVLAVIKPSSTQASGSTVLYWGTDGSGAFGLTSGTTNNYTLRAGDGSSGNFSAPVVSAAADLAQVLSFVKSGTGTASYLNGAAMGTDMAPATLDTTPSVLVMGNWEVPYHDFHGEIAEVLIYNRALTTEEREGIEAGLAAKYVGEGAPANLTVTDGLRLWLDGLSAGRDSHGRTDVWTDQSGLHHDLTQEVEELRPISYEDGTGHVAVRFDGVDDVFQLPNVMDGATAGDLFIVARLKNFDNAHNGLADFGAGPHGTAYSQDDASPTRHGTIWDDFGIDDSAGFEGPGSTTLTGWHVYNASADGDGQTLRFNGDELLHRDLPMGDPTVEFGSAPLLGANLNDEFFNGDIAEVIAYDRVLSTAERAAVEGYLEAKYAPAALPVPTGFTATGLSDSVIQLEWHDDSITETGDNNPDPNVTGMTVISVERKTGEEDFVEVGEGRLGNNGYTDTGLAANTSYTYRIRYRVLLGGSDYTAAATATTLTAGRAVPSGGLRLWLNGDVGPEVDGEGHVATWVDQSGAGHNVVQETSGHSPLFVSDAANGHAALRFDGTDDVYNLPDVMNAATAGDLFIVARLKNFDRPYNGLAHFGTSPNGMVYSRDNEGPYRNGAIWDDFGFSNGGAVDGPGSAVLRTWHVYNGTIDSTGQNLRFNGVDLFFRQLPTDNPVVEFRSSPLLGSDSNNEFFNGDIAEVIAYDRVLSQFEREVVQNYLKAKYSPETAPAPSNLQATATSSTAIHLEWEIDPADTHTAIAEIERKEGLGDYVVVASQPADDLAFDDLNRTPSTEYTYRVRLRTLTGVSDYTDPASATTTAVELPVSTGLRLWLDAGVGVSAAADGYAWGWADLSGLGHNLLQVDLDARPRLVSDAANGHPALRFDGTNDVYNLPDVMNSATAGDLFIVARLKNFTHPYNGLTDFGTGSNGTAYSQDDESPTHHGTIWDDFGFSDSSGFEGPGSTVLTGWHVYNASIDTDGQTLRFNGDELLHRDLPMDNPVVEFRSSPILGSDINNEFFNGDIAEVIAYDHVLSPTDRASIEAYLNAKYLDTDDDGLPDDWELRYLGTLSYGAMDDPGDVGRTLQDSFDGGLNPWPAATVTNGLRAWYRADLGVVKDGDDKVSQWLDLSGSGFHVVQTDGTQQPVAVAGAVNGNPAVQFALSGTALRTASLVDLMEGAQTMTMIAVVKPDATQGSGATILDHDWTGAAGVTVAQASNGHFRTRYEDATSAERESGGVDLTAGGVQVYSVVKDESFIRDYLNGEVRSIVIDAAGLHEGISALAVGNTASHSSTAGGFNGQIAEILIYNRVLTTEEREDTESALMTKYVNADSDDDGLPDAWEQKNLGTLSYGAMDDPGDVGRSLLDSYTDELSPWPAATVADGLRVWYRADLGLVADGSGKVSKWVDLSGNGFHLAQTTAALQPTTASGAMNGNPAVQFALNGNYLRTPVSVDLLATASDLTVITVVQPDTTQGASATILDYNAQGASGLTLARTTGSHYETLYRDGSGNNRNSVGANLTTGAAQVYSLVKDSVSAQDYLDGEWQGQIEAGTGLYGVSALLAVGNRAGSPSNSGDFHGKIAEILIYNRALTVAEREEVEAALRTKYAGESGPELPPADGRHLWLRADAGTYLDGDGRVATWSDQSGQGNDAVQDEPASRPLLVSSAANGHPALRFDGSDDLYTLPDVMNGATAGELFIVARLKNFDHPYNGLADFGTGPNGTAYSQDNEDPDRHGTIWDDFGFSDGDAFDGPGSAVLTSWHVYNASVDDNGQTLRFNGAELLHRALPMGNPVVEFRSAPLLGSDINNEFFNGDIAEVIAYDRLLTEEERATVVTYLNAKYAPASVTAPTDLTAAAQSSTQIRLEWTVDSTAADTAIAVIERKTGEGDFAEVTRLGAGVGAYLDTLLVPNTTYTYRIKLHTLASDSDYSDTIEETTLEGSTEVPMGGMRLWLKADAGTHLDENGRVSTWSDQSGQSQDAVQSTANARPLLVTDEAGHATLRFDGVDDLYVLPDVMNGATAGDLFVVARLKNFDNQYNGLLRFGTSENGTAYSQDNASLTENGTIWDDFGTSDPNGFAGPGADVLTSWHVYNASVDSNGNTLRFNGEELLHRALPTDNPVVVFNSAPTLGWCINSAPFNGDIAEVIAYDRMLTEEERAAVETYLTAKYAQAALPAPTGLTATALSSTGTHLEWDANPDVPGATTVVVERKSGAGDFAKVGEIAMEEGEFFDTSLLPETTYTYRIKLQTVLSQSDYSDTADATTLEGSVEVPASGMRLWLKADAGTTLDGNGRVSTWSDQSGQDQDAVQSDANARPLLVTDETGHATLRFDGVDDLYVLPDVMNSATAGDLFVVARLKNFDTQYNGLLQFGTSSNGTAYSQDNVSPTENGTIWDDFGTSDPDGFPGPGGDVLTSWHIYNASVDEDGHTLRFNGEVVLNRALPMDNPVVVFNTAPTLGYCINSAPFNGDIAEVIAYDRVLSSEERAAVQLYLNNKYIATELPKPAGVTATALSDSEVRLQWEGNPAVLGSTALTIERKTGEGDFAEVGEVTMADGEFVDTDLDANTAYVYRIKLHNLAVASAYSDTATATTFPSSADMPTLGMRLWLRADAGTTLDGSGRVTTWSDQSTEEQDVTQSDADSRPLLVNDAISGHPVLRFDGVDDVYNLPDVMNGATAGDLFIVARLKNFDNAYNGLTQFGTGPNGTAYSKDSESPTEHGRIWDDFGFSDGDAFEGPGSPTLTTWHVYNASIDEDGQTLRFNGQELLERDLPMGNPVVEFRSSPILGADANNEFFNGDIAEVIAYDRVLSPTERTAVQAYLAAKYAPGVPEAPSELEATALSPTKVRLTWQQSAPDHAAIATIERKTGAGSYTVVAEVPAIGQYVDLSLAADTTYTYRLKLRTLTGSSDYSDAAEVTTLETVVGMPTDGMRLWLKASTGVTSDGSGYVSAWADQSGLHNDATQNTSAARPQWLDDGGAGFPVVRFDGTNDELNLPVFMGSATEGELFVVARTPNYGTREDGLWSLGGADGAKIEQKGSDWKLSQDFGRNSRVDVGIPVVSPAGYISYDFAAKTNDWKVRLNGQLQYQTDENTVQFATHNLLGVGGTAHLQGDIVEVIAYDHVLSAAEREEVEAYLTAKTDPAGDADGDGVPNGEDARPNDPTVGALTISIINPANGSTQP